MARLTFSSQQLLFMLALLSACACSLALEVGVAKQEDSNQLFSSLLPSKYIVDLSYEIDGVLSAPPPCTEYDPSSSSCLPKVRATQDTILIKYSINATAAPAGANATSTIKLKACFSPSSSVDRPWRAPNNNIGKDKQCLVAIQAGLPPTGEYRWTPGPYSAPGTYQVMLLEICQDGLFCNMAKSAGYYQIVSIDSRPGWLMALVGVFCTLGPISLAAFFYFERVYKKTV